MKATIIAILILSVFALAMYWLRRVCQNKINVIELRDQWDQ